MNIINYIEQEGNKEIVDILFISTGYIYDFIRNHSDSVKEILNYKLISLDASGDNLVLSTPNLELVIEKENFNKRLNFLLQSKILKNPSVVKDIKDILLVLDYFFKKFQFNYVLYIGKPYIVDSVLTSN